MLVLIPNTLFPLCQTTYNHPIYKNLTLLHSSLLEVLMDLRFDIFYFNVFCVISYQWPVSQSQYKCNILDVYVSSFTTNIYKIVVWYRAILQIFILLISKTDEIWEIIYFLGHREILNQMQSYIRGTTYYIEPLFFPCYMFCSVTSCV